MSGAYVTIMDTMLMILVICALRFLLRPASARFRCLLWAIVPLRLLCPFVVPSIFSIYQVSDVARDILFPPRSVQIPLNASPASASTFPADLWNIISVCGTVILLTWGAVQMIRLKHDLREAVPLKDDVDEIVRYAGKLQEMGARNVLVSMAGDGAVLLDENGGVHACGVCKGTVKNSVGAGDSMAAGFVAGCETGDYDYALKLGTATGGATAFSEGLAKKELIAEL